MCTDLKYCKYSKIRLAISCGCFSYFVHETLPLSTMPSLWVYFWLLVCYNNMQWIHQMKARAVWEAQKEWQRAKGWTLWHLFSNTSSMTLQEQQVFLNYGFTNIRPAFHQPGSRWWNSASSSYWNVSILCCSCCDNERLFSHSAAEFGFFSCIINGEEREQSHRAVFR